MGFAGHREMLTVAIVFDRVSRAKVVEAERVGQERDVPVKEEKVAKA